MKSKLKALREAVIPLLPEEAIVLRGRLLNIMAGLPDVEADIDYVADMFCLPGNYTVWLENLVDDGTETGRYLIASFCGPKWLIKDTLEAIHSYVRSF